MSKSKSLFTLSAAALTVLFGINKYIDTNSVSSNKKPSGKFFHWKQGDVYYKKQGSGSPILLIHDLTVFSSNFEWSQIMSDLAKSHTVYAIDLLGCGKSDKPEVTYTNFYYVQMISDFVKEIIGEKTDILVSGLSGSFVIMADALNSDLFGKITMINPKSMKQLKSAPDDRSKMLVRLFNLPIIGKAAYYLATCKSNTDYYLTEQCFYNPFHINKALYKSFYNASHTGNGNGKALLASIEGKYINMDISKALKNTNKEITLILGEGYEYAEDVKSSYTKINPSIETIVIPKSKLLPHFESADSVLKSI